MVRRWGLLGWWVLVASVGACGEPRLLERPEVPVEPDAEARDGGPEAAFPESGIGSTELRVTRVVPGHGPFTGGTQAVVRGSGFTDEALVFVGGRMVQPADTTLVDGNRLAIVLPAGEPGPAEVRVRVGDEEASLPDGYVYDALALDPTRGAVAGGTLVRIEGRGVSFDAGDEVWFGGARCREVTILGEETLTCRTPPGSVGEVDVRVVRARDGSEVVAVDAFTYYDESDPYGGGLGGGPLAGELLVNVVDAMTGLAVPDAFVFLGDAPSATLYRGMTNLLGQIAFSGDDLSGRQVVTVAKDCYERTSFVAFDARVVTVFLVPWMDPACGMGSGAPPGGRGRAGSFVQGELFWKGPREFGPNPWVNVPDPRPGEEKVAYVFATRPCATDSIYCLNPDPALGGARPRVTERDVGENGGYRYSLFVRPGAFAVYAVAGVENVETGEFTPYVMGVTRGVLVGPGDRAEGVRIVMDIPLDHRLAVEVGGLPEMAATGPDRFRVSLALDLGGDGYIVRAFGEGGDPFDAIASRVLRRPFRFFAQPALQGPLAGASYRIEAAWVTGDFDAPPLARVVAQGVRPAGSEPVRVEGFLGIPKAIAPAYGEELPGDRILRWEAPGGAEPSFYMVTLQGGDGNPAWRHVVRGDVTEAPIPDLSSVEGLQDVAPGSISWMVFAVHIPGFDFDEFSYAHLNERYWDAWSIDLFTARR